MEWTADEHWKALLEDYSREDIMEELEKMEEEGLLPDDSESLPMFAAARPGCTPFEFINFTDEFIEHDIAITVRHPADITKPSRSAESLRGAACRFHAIR